MRARIIETKSSSEIIEAGIQLTKDVLVPAARAQAGFAGYIGLYDAEQGIGLAITLWKDDATEAASDEAARPQREQLAASFGAEVTVHKYDVAVVDLPSRSID